MKVDTSDISCGVDQIYDLDSVHLDQLFRKPTARPTIDQYKDNPASCRPSLAYEAWLRALDEYEEKVRSYDSDATVPGMTYIFSDWVKKGTSSGHKLAAYIRKHRLGRLRTLGPTRNPHSGHTIQTWMFVRNKKFIGEKNGKAKR